MDHNVDGIEFTTSPSGRIGWMRHWGELDMLIDRAVVRTRDHGAECYGHTSYYYVPAMPGGRGRQ